MIEKSKLNFEALKANRNISARNYWRNRLKDFEWNTYFNQQDLCPEFPIEKDDVEFTLTAPEKIHESLKNISGSVKADHVVLLAALGVLLQKYTSYSDVIVFTPNYLMKAEPSPGGNLIPARMLVSPDQSFLNFLTLLKQDLVQDFKYGDYPFENIMDKAGEAIKRENAIIMYVEDLQLYPSDATALIPDLLFLFEIKDSLSLRIKYARNKFDVGYIAQIANLYFSCLYALITHKEQRIAEIDINTVEGKNDLIFKFNKTDAYYPSTESIVSLFEQQVVKTPENIALIGVGEQWTYKKLKEKSDEIALYLQNEFGVTQFDMVGLILEREPYFVAAVIGIMKCGAAYVPIDADYPADRINAIIEKAKLKVIITRGAVSGEEISIGPAIIDLNTMVAETNNHFTWRPVTLNATDIAYVLFTSGSTGVPKGVVIEHKSLVNYVYWAARFYLKGEKASMPLYTSVSFDLTVTSIFMPLITGNSIVIYSDHGNESGIERLFADDKVNIIKLTPSHLKMIKDSDRLGSSLNYKLKKLIVGGEELETKLAWDIYEKFEGNVEIYNEYGPTEATVGCMIHKFDPKEKLSTVPIGLPINNTQIYILDQSLKPVPFGSNGEIYISGDGVAKGYLADEERNSQKFLINPFIKGERMYKTGDQAYRNFLGDVIFKGRIDDQVKIRGFRVELTEIEGQLLGYGSSIKEVTVIVKKREGEQYLVAYYTAEAKIDSDVLRDYLLNKLPYYMVPFYFVFLTQMPLTRNGKLDRNSLKDPELSSNENYVAPSGKMEEQLVEMWSVILQLDKEVISINKSFFELGGNSLKVVQLNMMINETFTLNISIPSLFRYSTISAFVNFINSEKRDLKEQNKEADNEVTGMQNAIDNLFKH